MSSLSPKDRVSLCSFTFSDGRRCRTPRVAKHPRFCFYHAQKEARARTAKKLGKDLAYFFSGDYLSACDLSTALARLIPAVVRGDVKPKTAHTVAYLAQTLMQAIHVSEQEYINAFGTDRWRKSVRNSVNSNYDYRFPPDPAPELPQVVAGLQTGGGQAPQPAPSPHTSLPPTSAEFVQRVVAGLQTGGGQTPQPAPSPHTSLPPTSAEFAQRVVAGLQTGGGQTPQPSPAPPKAATPSPAPAPSPTSSRAPQTPAARTAPSSPACPPGRNESSCPDPAVPTADETDPLPATQFVPLVAPAVLQETPRTSPSPPPPNRDAYALHFDQGCRLLVDGKPF
jgi:hypothetical protein